MRAHRHGTARLGVLVAHLLDQSGVFGVWSTVARGGRGLRVRSHLLLTERTREIGISNSSRKRRRPRVTAADSRGVDCSAEELRGVNIQRVRRHTHLNTGLQKRRVTGGGVADRGAGSNLEMWTRVRKDAVSCSTVLSPI